jgi:hypothetical protein
MKIVSISIVLMFAFSVIHARVDDLTKALNNHQHCRRDIKKATCKARGHGFKSVHVYISHDL